MENIIFEQFKVDPPLGIKRVLTLAVVHGKQHTSHHVACIDYT